ncbi:MAG: ABC transporter ATP-binding protein [Chloroflexi bacterium]|nr:ABC transporter ATP-binding protein [Chloroflexota bacterium]MCI0577634.1 ABC transporter ATP-binding protein [Chloroflexota bacterium]MCI0647587.1 ABC transporter ATP-binding protein [Chloroflexota bacterium]MCI0732170.1 ABC transporter ATP-binding protein [Chloroflexota bacterium]
MPALITVTQLSKTFQMGRQKVHALDRVDLAVAPQTFSTVMGPSGSGKSTLLYLLGGLDRPTSGQIVVEGQSLEAMDENALAEYRRRKVGFVFQSFNLIASLSALENVAYPMRFAGVPRRRRLAVARDLLQRVGLGDRLLHKPTELSGGQQQRVAIARALVNDPALILADEPTGNLDTASGQAIMQLLAELHHHGRTVLVVTHELRMTAYATNTLYMLDGRIVSHAEYEAATAVANPEPVSTSRSA